MDVLVFGAGAVGLGLASALLAAGERVRLVGRAATVAALRRHGLVRSGVLGAHTARPEAFEAAETLGALSPDPCDFALVATKSFDSTAAAERLAACPDVVAPHARLVLCQNGWGNAERFLPRFDRERVFSARVITGFRRPAPHAVEVTVHAEPVRMGSLFGTDAAPLEPLCAALSRGGLPAETTATIARDLWAKLLYNGVLNPLGAIFGVAYGALGASPPGRALVETLAREIFAVMRAAGHDTHQETADAWLDTLHGRLLPATARHESSMLQDLRAGRRTEIDALTGAVVALGDRHGVPVPANRTVLEMIRFLEARAEGRSRT